MSGLVRYVRGDDRSARAERALTAIHQRAAERAEEIVGIEFVGFVAMRAVARTAVRRDEMQKLCPPSTEIYLAPIQDSICAAIQSRVLELLDGL